MAVFPTLNGMFCQVFRPAAEAHRGASRRFPENSLAAIKEAINMAMNHPEVRFFVEMDLRSAKDGELVILHDSHVDRTAHAKGEVRDLTSTQLQSLRLKPVSDLIQERDVDHAREPEPFYPITERDFRVPTLKEVIALTEHANERRSRLTTPIGLALEVKSNDVGKGWLSRLFNPVLRVVAGALSNMGFPVLANHVFPPPESVATLANLLNERYSQGSSGKIPMLVFSTAGTLGKRDMKQLWEQLSLPAKTEFLPRAAQQLEQPEAPLTPYLIDHQTVSLIGSSPYEGSLTHAHAQSGSIATWLGFAQRPFRKPWLIGTLAPDSEKTHLLPDQGISIVCTPQSMNTMPEIESAINQHATIIASDRPDLVITALEKCYAKSKVDEVSPSPQLQQALQESKLIGFVEKHRQRQNAVQSTIHMRNF